MKSTSAKIRTELLTVTPELAAQLLAQNYERQRRIRSHHVTRLAKMMLEGHFRFGSTITFALLNDEKHLVDGQHTLNAGMRSASTLTLLAIYHRVADLAELRHVYASFGRELQRSPRDVLDGMGLDDTLGLNGNDVAMLHGALRWILNDFRAPSGFTDSVNDILHVSEAMDAWLPEMRDYLQAIQGSNLYLTQPIRQQVVAATALATLKPMDIRHRALEFWLGVAHDDRLGRGDPRKALVNFLTGRGHERHYSAVQRLYAVASCWNAYHDERELNVARPVAYSNSIGVTLRGTPYHAQRISRTGPTPQQGIQP